MMSPHDNMKPPAGKEETNVSSARKTAAASSRPPQDPPPKCPRCDSPNTKFCYYNNYSLTQPRHFCKTCRRYWTNGGALRNVPIGGGCRKSKKIKPSPRTSDESNSDVGGLKFFQGLSPAMDFQLNFPRNAGLLNQFSSLDNLSSFSLDNPSAASSSSPMGFGFQEMGSLNCQGSNLTSSIESLSSINQDLHWKLQKQRLGLLFVGDNHHKQNNNYNMPSFETLVQNQKPQPIMFQNLDLSCAADIGKDDAGDACGNNNTHNNISLSTEWFFDNSYATAVNPTPATSGTNLNGDTNNWNGVQDLY